MWAKMSGIVWDSRRKKFTLTGTFVEDGSRVEGQRGILYQQQTEGSFLPPGQRQETLAQD